MDNLISKAVEPTRAAALEAAQIRAEAIVASYAERLKANGFDLDKTFPYPRSTLSRPDYMKAKNQRNFAQRITTRINDKGVPYMNRPYFCMMNESAIGAFYNEVADTTNAQFDAYVAKLTTKIGECTSATLLTSGGVWSYSTLQVTKPSGVIERWNTRCIVNVSVLGKVFNQWPTRLGKPGKKAA
jgi:hypothetical protein